MNRNPDKNVLTDFPFRLSYYLLRPWKFVRECWHNLQNAWFRITRGIAPVDLWSYDTHLNNQIPYALRWLADNSHGWPQSEQFPEYEDWAEYLRELANKWDYAFMDWVYYGDENEYDKDYHALLDKLTVHEKDSNGFLRSYVKETPELLDLQEKYRAREQELIAKHQRMQHECWAAFEAIFNNLWD